ncbi:unnamed protein product [Caenorhabditis angaria]|uniref:Uncharacterized protein n=1 Tax=Caenorhabditis angaria TaxID=860376 RepID=A0A9P1N7B7_9PELO|nr:unnamed protein product [Caenorhabditis angaria]
MNGIRPASLFLTGIQFSLIFEAFKLICKNLGPQFPKFCHHWCSAVEKLSEDPVLVQFAYHFVLTYMWLLQHLCRIQISLMLLRMYNLIFEGEQEPGYLMSWPTEVEMLQMCYILAIWRFAALFFIQSIQDARFWFTIF